MPVKRCALCTSNEFALVIDLGLHPLADTFVREQSSARSLPRYPLTVLRCLGCGHVYTGVRVPPERRYQETEYSYDSSNSLVAEEHFNELACSVASFANLSAGDLVVDIGGNVGTLLSSFRTHIGARVINVEPSANIAKLAEQGGIPTLQRFWDAEAAERIFSEGRAAVVAATNVLNHIDDLDAFFLNLDRALSPRGIFVVEVPYLLTLIERAAFDTMYVEHVSYMAVKPLRRYLAQKGFRIMRVETNDYMGGSIALYIGRGDEGSEVAAHVAREEESGLYEEDTYRNFRSRVAKCKEDLISRLRETKARGGVIIGIGAATKGNTLLNYCEIDDSLLAYITDVSPLKVGKYTPGSAIPIRSDGDIGEDVTHALILAWNISDFLKAKLSVAHPALRFIIPHMA